MIFLLLCVVAALVRGVDVEAGREISAADSQEALPYHRREYDEDHTFAAFPTHRMHESDGVAKFFAAHAFRRQRVFRAEADAEVDCDAPIDPCGLHGTCVRGTGCVCDQEAQKGFWSGTTCNDCDVGWAGSDCKTECLGGSCNECSGHGTCRSGTSGDGSCECYDDNSNGHWSGQDCSSCSRNFFGDSCLQACPGADSGLGACHGRGLCSANDAGEAVCACDAGWDETTGCGLCDTSHWGSTCQNTCDGYNATTLQPCSGHGTCFNGTDANGTCVCFPGSGWGTFDCSRQCENLCSEPNGVCREGASNDATCECKLNFALPDCAVCIANRTGTECELDCPLNPTTKAVCSDNGKCTFLADNTTVRCDCAPGYYGTVCDMSCPGNPPCSGHGTCNAGVCQCFSDATNGYWDGPVCDTCQLAYNQSLACDRQCPTYNGQVCNGHGQCAEGRCYCVRRAVEDRMDYCGSACETFSQPGLTDNDGQCLKCTCVYCDQEYMLGAACLIPCAGRPAVGGSACNNRGFCAEGRDARTDQCVCDPAYTGSGCDQTCTKDFYGRTCSGISRGYCTSRADSFGGTVAHCQCYSQFAGEFCQLDCPVVDAVACAGHGRCNNTYVGDGACICEAGWTGRACNVPCLCDKLNGQCTHSECADLASYTACDKCSCRGNFTGMCDECIAGTQGQNCEGSCVNGRTNGKVCVCDELWSTAACDVPCPRNETTQEVCSSHGTCNWGEKNAGDCTCHPAGRPVYFGPTCAEWCVADEKCTVAPYNMLHPQCNAKTGACECQRDQNGYWDGDNCDVCLIGFWGSDCADECQCNDHGGCDKDTGACVCFSDSDRGFYTGQNCEGCADGYIGERCERRNVLITRMQTNDTAGYQSPNNDALRQSSSALPAPTSILVDESLRQLYAGSLPVTKFTLESGMPQRSIASYDQPEVTAADGQNATLYCGDEVFLAWVHQNSIYYLMQPSDVCGQDLRLLKGDRLSAENLNFTAMDTVWTWAEANRTVRIVAAQALGEKPLQGQSAFEVKPVVVMALAQSSRPGGTGSWYAGGTVLRVDAEIAAGACKDVELPVRTYELPTDMYPSSIALQAPAPDADIGCNLEAEIIAIGGSRGSDYELLMLKKDLGQGGAKKLAPAYPTLDPADASMRSHVPCWPATGDANGDTGSAASTIPSETCAGCRGVDRLSFFDQGNLLVAMHVEDDAKRKHSFVVWIQPFDKVVHRQSVLAKLIGTTRCTSAYYDAGAFELVDTTDATRRDPTLPSFVASLARVDAPSAFITSLTVDEAAGIAFAAFQYQTASTAGFLEKFYLRDGQITVHGQMALSLMSVAGVATAEVLSELVVDSPGRVLHGLITGTKQTRIISLLLTEIHSVVPALADQRGGTLITVHGSGFVQLTNSTTGAALYPILCSFGGLTASAGPVEASNVTFDSIVCPITQVDNTSSSVESCDGQPVDVSVYGMTGAKFVSSSSATRRQTTGVGGIQLSVTNRGFFTNSETAVRRVQSARIESVSPDRGGLSGGTVVTLRGQGFTQSASALCKFFSNNPLATEVLYSPMRFVDPTTAECTQPAAGFASLEESFLDVTLDGQMYTEAGPVNYEIVGVPANLSSPEVSLVVAQQITAVSVDVSIVDDQRHRLGRLDMENRTVCLVPNITEEICQEGLFSWREIGDGYPWPPCRNNTLILSSNESMWCRDTFEGEVTFDGIHLEQPRATTAVMHWEYNGWFAETRLIVTEGAAVALAISNVRELVGKTAPRGVALSPAPEIIAVDELGNILQNPGASITISAQTFYVMDEDPTEVVPTNRYVQLHRSESNKVSFATIVFQYIHGAAHYINFTSDNPVLAPATSPTIRTTLCENPERNYKLSNYSECAPCPPEGAVCNGTEVIEVLPGYWRGTTDRFIYECPGGPEVCLGSQQMRGAPCAKGYEGPLCSRCVKNWGRSGPASCTECTDEGESFAWVIFGVVATVGFLLAWALNTLRTAEFKDHQVIIRTVVNHVQAAGKLGEFSTQWSPFLKTLFAVQESSSSMSFSGVASLDCLLRARGLDYSTIFTAYMLLPIVAVFMAFGVFVVVRVLKMKPVISEELEHEIREDIKAIGTRSRTAILLHRYPLYMVVVTVLCVTMFTLYQTLITQATTVLVCSGYVTEEGKTEYFLDVDRTIPCDEKSNHKFRTAALLCAAGYGVGIPLAFIFGYMFVNGVIGKQALTYQMFMFLIAGYQEKFWWWQSIIMVRKMVLVFIIVFVRDNAHLQSYCGMWAMSAALIAQIWFQPNSKPEFNLVESLSLALITVTLNLGLLYFWPDIDGFGKGVLTAVLIIISIGVFVMFGFFLYAPIKDLIMENVNKGLAGIKELRDKKAQEGEEDGTDGKDKGPKKLQFSSRGGGGGGENGSDDRFSDDSDLERIEDDDVADGGARRRARSTMGRGGGGHGSAGILRLPKRAAEPAPVNQAGTNFDFDLEDDGDLAALGDHASSLRRADTSTHHNQQQAPAGAAAAGTGDGTSMFGNARRPGTAAKPKFDFDDDLL